MSKQLVGIGIHATIARIGAENDVKKLQEIACAFLDGEEYMRAQEEANKALLAIFRLWRMADRAVRRHEQREQGQQNIFAQAWEAPGLSGHRPELDALRREE